MKTQTATTWLSVKEAAARLGCSQDKVRRWLASGQLSGIREGRRWRIAQDSLAEHVPSNSERPYLRDVTSARLTPDTELALIRAGFCPVCTNRISDKGKDYMPEWGWTSGMLRQYVQCEVCNFSVHEKTAENAAELHRCVSDFLAPLFQAEAAGRKAYALLLKRYEYALQNQSH